MNDSRLAVTVLGAGLMGAAIAAEYATAGNAVRITTSHRTSGADAVARVQEQSLSARNELDIRWFAAATEAVADADLVIESLPEDLDMKQGQLAEAQLVAPEAILATNTSSLTVTSIAAALQDPTRLVGTHYLNPPGAFRILELVPGTQSSPFVITRMEEILRSLGKTPVLLRQDIPGFVINRLQFALLREALHLLEQGVVAPEDLDRLMEEGLARRWAAIGPFTTVSLGGPGVFRQIAQSLFPQLSRDTRPPDEIMPLRLTEKQRKAARARRDRALLDEGDGQAIASREAENG